MHMGQRGRYADIQRDTLGARDRETWGEREGCRETIPAIGTDRYTGKDKQRYRSETKPQTETYTEGQAGTGTERHTDMTDT